MSEEKRITGMQEGAFALIDVLGFKGIWRQVQDVDIIIKKLRGIQDFKDDPIVKMSGSSSGLRLLSLSDSVAICGHISDADPRNAVPRAGGLIYQLCVVVNELTRRFGSPPLPMAIRGCIAYGQFRMEDNFILGPAVDTAAELHTAPQGAFVWLSPAARAAIENFQLWLNDQAGSDLLEAFGTTMFTRAVAGASVSTFMDESQKAVTLWNDASPEQRKRLASILGKALGQIIISNVLTRYPLPIKGGETIDTYVINPVSGPPMMGDEVKNAVLESMRGEGLDVLSKRFHTEKFFDYLYAREHQKFEEIKKLIRSAYAEVLPGKVG
jgi:hypothetical protein